MKREELMQIGDAAQITGLSIPQIRYWSDKGFVSPTISRHGDICYRFYGPEEIRKLKQIKANLDKGYTLSASVNKLRKEGGNDEK